MPRRARALRLSRPVVPESAVLDAVLRYLAVLERQGRVALVRRVNVLPAYGPDGRWRGWSVRDGVGEPYRGHPDVECVLVGSGRMVWIEAKRSGGAVSAEQRERLAAGEAAGALCVVASSVEDVAAALVGE